MLHQTISLFLLAALAAPFPAVPQRDFDPTDVVVVQIDGVTRADVVQLTRLGVDIDGVDTDRYTREVVGFHYSRDYKKVHYIDPDLHNLKKSSQMGNI